MTREDLIVYLKEYKENKAKLNIKLKELKTARIKLKYCEDTETNLTSSFGINQDIHSKNQINNKVLRKVEENETKREELLNKIEKLEDVDDRLEGLKYKEKQLLVAYYIDGRSYEEIGNQLYFQLFNQTRSWETIKKIIEKATKKMIKL